jgi:peptidoglycan/LPS O-acetylase OafA/YrhL
MNRELSLYLDFCRFCAAAMVFLSHVTTRQWSGGFLWQLGGYGEDAVAVFFVLSGFVIGYVSDARENAASSYTASRLARLWSVAVPALILTFLLDAIGRTLDPDIYRLAYAGYVADNHLWQFVSALFFVDEIWNTHTEIGSNGPYWSLGYEAWYYAIFGMAAFGPRRWRWAGCAALLAVIGPKIAVLFPLWLMGLVCFRLTLRWQAPSWLGWPMFVGAPCAILALHIVFRHAQANMFDPFSLAWPRLTSTLYFTGIGALFAAHIIGFHAVRDRFSTALAFCNRPIRSLAGHTFSLYLFHMPIITFLVAASPWPVDTWQTRSAILLLTPVAVFGFARISEDRKDEWRAAVGRIFGEFATLIEGVREGRR